MAEKRKYWVDVPEVHISTREIEAESAEQARELAPQVGAEVALAYDRVAYDSVSELRARLAPEERKEARGG